MPLDDSISSLLKSVVDHFEKEDMPTRERQLRRWSRLKLYWNNLSQVYWAESTQSYKIAEDADLDQAYYDRPVNVFKAFLETIIAALSIQIPAIACIPDDATNPLDISTAKSGDIIGGLIYKHNNVMFVWLQALYVYCTEGMIACYTYVKEDKSYGTYQKKKYESNEEEGYFCTNCQTQLEPEMFIASQLIKNAQEYKFDPDSDDNELDHLYEDDDLICPACAEEIDPNLQKSKLIIKRLVGVTDEPKSRVTIEVYGGLYIKISNSAKEQKDTPYLIYAYETHYSNALEVYPELRDKMPQGGWSTTTGPNNPSEEYARLNPQYGSDYPEHNVTVRNCWLRPAAFNILPEADYKKLKKKFPNGVKLVLVNDICADYITESLDDHWTLSRNPMSDYLTHEPLGELLTSIQDIVNDLISLTLQTIEHGISQTWVDPAVVNIPAQGQIEAAPGTLTAVKQVNSNKNISEAFYQTKTASLSPEIFQFFTIVQQLGQFVSGALPALFGGAQTTGSETASQYAMSKSSAMQRLQTPWKMMNIMWRTMFAKAIPQYMKCIQDDERIVKKDDQGNFVNVFIRKAELEGSIGDFELEASEQIPITEEQQADIIMKLMTLNNEQLMGALMSPENIPFIKKVVRIPQFKLPGEDDRQKQYEEIQLLVNEQPIVTPPEGPEVEEMQLLASEGDEAAAMTLQQLPPTENPSVEVDPDVDNHEIEADICRGWLISEAGRLAKTEKPEGYKNVLLHMKAHIQIIQDKLMEQQMMQQQQELAANINSGKANPKKPARPETIEKESDARTPITN